MAGCRAWVFFSVAGAIFLLYLLFVAGVAHHTHTHIHISRTLANFFPDTFLTSWRILPQTHLWDERCIFLVFFILVFCSPYPSFSKKNIFKHFDNPPSRPQNAIKFMSRTPQNIREIHPKFSYNQFCIIIWNPSQLIHTYVQFSIVSCFGCFILFSFNILRCCPPSIPMCCSICSSVIF